MFFNRYNGLKTGVQKQVFVKFIPRNLFFFWALPNSFHSRHKFLEQSLKQGIRIWNTMNTLKINFYKSDCTTKKPICSANLNISQKHNYAVIVIKYIKQV